jgi:hypothetical protein
LIDIVEDGALVTPVLPPFESSVACAVTTAVYVPEYSEVVIEVGADDPETNGTLIAAGADCPLIDTE